MTGYQSKKKAAQDKLDSMEREALKLALETFESMNDDSIFEGEFDGEIAVIKEALAQPAQDKLGNDDRSAYYKKYDDLYAVYLNGVYDGKKAALASLEQNNCPLCNKRTWNIHTCTPPQENT